MSKGCNCVRGSGRMPFVPRSRGKALRRVRFSVIDGSARRCGEARQKGHDHMTADRLIAGRYRLAERIGTGAMGVVWRATDERLQRVVAVKQVSLAEEYLADHFPTYPVLPGVMMLEAMVQAARTMLAQREAGPLVLGQVKALKYGAMVRPGEALVVEVTLSKELGDGSFLCRGVGTVRRAGGGEMADGETAVSGRFTMRPIRTG